MYSGLARAVAVGASAAAVAIGAAACTSTVRPGTSALFTSPSGAIEPSPSGGAASSPGTTASPEPVADKERADHEALRLLSLAQLPPGAVELTAPPTALRGPAMGTSATSSFIDHTRYWRVPMPFAAAAAWIKAHPPEGLTAGGSESGSTHGVLDDVGYSYVEPDTDAWVEAQYEVAVVPDGTAASYLRTDGTDNWLDPVPQRVGGTGKRLSITVARGCPASDSGYGGVTNAGRELDSALLPSGQPTDGLICVYDGMNGKPFSLIASKPLDGAAAGQLAMTVSRISLSHLDDVTVNCPMDDGAAAVLVFSYPGRTDVDLWYARNGCQSLGNGEIYGSPGDALYSAVQSAVPALGSPPPHTP